MVDTPIPVMRLSKFWCLLKGVLVQLPLVCLGPVRGNPEKV